MKNSFVLYTEQRETFNELSDKQAGVMIKAIYSYVAGEEDYDKDLNKTLKLLFIQFKQQIDRDNEKYENTRIRRSMAGKKHKGNQYKNIEMEQMEQNGTNGSDNVNVNDNGNIPLKGGDIPKLTLCTSEMHDRHSSKEDLKLDKENFEMIWKEYPRKDGKTIAFQKYRLYVNQGKEINGERIKLTPEQIYNAVCGYAKEVKNREKNFIKTGSTFFNNSILDYVDFEEEKEESEDKQNE